MITFKNIAGNKFLAVGTIQRKSALNGEKSLTGTLYDGDDVLNKIDKGWSLEFDNEPYIVTYFERNDNDNSVSFDAIHKFFWDMAKNVLYSETSGSHTIKWYLDQIFANTGYSYALNFNPNAIAKDNWGMKNKLSLFNDVITSIEGEFEINGTLVSIFKNIGTDLSTIVRYGFNLSDMTIENDASGFVTYGEGFGAYADQDNMTGDRLHVTYTSPLASVYGKLQAEPIDDQRYTIESNLLDAVKSQVDASFSISVNLSLYDLSVAGYPYKMANVGDWLTAVDENLDFKQRIRIISIDDAFAADGTRISYSVTAGDIGLTKKYQDANASIANKVEDAVISAGQAATDANIALIAANGKNKSYYLNDINDLPKTANEGDLAWVQSGDGRVLYIYTKKADGTYYWEKRIDPEMGEQIEAGVNEAIAQANENTATAIEENNISQQEVMNDIAKSQADLAIKDGDFNNKAQAMADEALANAKANTATVAQETLNTANQNLAAAKSDLIEGLQKEVSDRSSAVSALDTKAQGYVDTAKNDINDTVNALSVGGRNYLLNSNGSTLSSWTPVSGWQVVSDSTRGSVFSFTPTVTWTGSSTNSISQSRTDFPTEKNVTVSFWAKASVDGAKFHSEPTGGNATENSLFNTTLTTAWKRYSYTFVLKTNRVYFMPVDTGTIYYLDDLQLETGNMMSDYKQAPEDVVLDYTTKDNEIKTAISQYQTTNDGKVSKVQTDVTTALGQVATKVSQTDYNTKTGQLQTDLTTTTQTANQAKTDIVSIKQKDSDQDSRMTSIESDASGVKTTVSDLKTAQGKQSGDISTLQQRADGFDATVTKVDNLSIGGRNYFLNSSGSSLDKWINNSNLWSITTDSIKGNVFTSNPTIVWTSGAQNALYQGGLDALKGQQVTVSFWAKADKANANFHSEPSGGAVKFNPKLTTSWAKYSYTIPNLATTTVYFMSVDVGTNYYLDNLKIESGNTATDWTPAPEDVDSATAKAQLTADQATTSLNAYKTDADGRISKAQSDIVQTAKDVTTKVSQTDYNAKTGELSTSVSKAQQTADSAVTTIGAYKTSNDNRVKATETSIEQNTKDITLRATNTDLDSAKKDYNDQIAQVKVDVDGISQSVSAAQTSINDLQQVNLLKNTEFNPDYASWVPNNDSGSVFIDNYWKHGSSNNIGIVRNNGATNWLHVVQNIPLTKNQVISFSVLGKVNTIYDGAIYLHVRAYDQTNKSLGDLYKVTQSQTNDFQTFKSENMTLPDGTVYVQVALGMYKNASVAFSQPILVVGSKVGSYVVGAYSDSEKISAQQITIDGITNIVSDPATGLSTRVQKAEGTLNTVKSTAEGAMSKASQTANDITQEIEDRTNGDSNTLQSAKDFTQSTITSYDSGLQSQITQTNSSLLATVSANNLIVDSSLNDSSFSNSLVNWSLGGNGKFYYSSGVAYKGVQSIGYNQSGLNGDYSWIDSYKWSNYSFAGTKLNISVDISVASMGGTSTDYLIIYLLELDESGNETARTNVTGTINSANGIWTNYRKSITVNSSSKYFLLRYQMRGNGNVYIARPYVGVQELVAGGYTAGTNNNNKTILSLFKDNWSIGISDNIGNITSGIVGNSSSMSLISKNITLDGNTTVTGDFYAKGGNFTNLNASNITVGTLNGNQVNITNVNAANITGDITNFIQSNWNGVYGSTAITSSGMTVTSPGTVALFNVNGMTLDGAGGMTRVANGFTQIYSATHENIGMIGHQKDVDHDNVDYITFGLNGYRTTNDGDSHWVGGSDFYGGDGMGFGVSNKKGTYDLKLRWDSDLIAGYKGELQGWHASDAFIFDDKTYHKGYADFSGGVTMSGAYSEGTRSLHTQGMSISTGAKWFGFMDSSNSTGFGTDQTQDVLFYVKGQVYSLYTMLGKLGMR